MSKKCLESVLVLGLALEKCPENVKKVSPQTFSRHFFDTFWQIESQKGAHRRAPTLRHARTTGSSADGRSVIICNLRRDRGQKRRRWRRAVVTERFEPVRERPQRFDLVHEG